MSNDVAPQRRRVYEKLDNLTDKLDGIPLADAIVILQHLQQENESKFDKLYLDLDHEPGYEDSCTTTLQLVGHRLENDNELADRLVKEEARQKLVQEREIAQLRELKTKYGF